MTDDYCHSGPSYIVDFSSDMTFANQTLRLACTALLLHSVVGDFHS